MCGHSNLFAIFIRYNGQLGPDQSCFSLCKLAMYHPFVNYVVENGHDP